EAVAVDAGAVRAALVAALIHLGEHPLVLGVAGRGIIVQRPDGLLQRIGVVHGAAVRTPCEPVRELHGRGDSPPVRPTVVTPDRADPRRVRLLVAWTERRVSRTHVEATLAVAVAVVEAEPPWIVGRRRHEAQRRGGWFECE